MQVQQSLRREYPFTHLLRHAVTGPGWSYTRDLSVAGWCRSTGVHWTEFAQERLPQTATRPRRVRPASKDEGRLFQRNLRRRRLREKLRATGD